MLYVSGWGGVAPWDSEGNEARMDAPAGSVRRLADDLWLLDTWFQGQSGVIACYLLAGASGLALIDVGPAACIEQLLAGVRAAGFAPEQIRHLVLTHIHLDHAGAAGTLTRMLPNARAYVHRIGVPHLVDPSRLLSSARRIYGDRMERWWGTIEPVPEERLIILDDGDTLAVAGRRLEVLYTPGHAVHHVAFHDAARHVIFPGDVAGVSLEGIGYVRPPTPPPDISLEDWYASIDLLEALRPVELYLPHFGVVREIPSHFAQLRAHLAEWGKVVLAGMRVGKDDQALAGDLAHTYDPQVAEIAAGDAEAVRRYELATNYLMTAQGYARYYRKHHPELLS
jgi:glyoxylase-like metal-dependent hydrolase (beta-lactamase superfamily II)